MDEPELRAKLTDAWRAVGRRLLDEGYDPKLVTETMFAVAVASWAGTRSEAEAAEHLRSLADAIERGDHNDAAREDRGEPEEG